MIRMPEFSHELFGEYQTKSSLIIILTFVLISGMITAFIGHDQMSDLTMLKQLVSWLIFIDIAGGVVANFSRGTDRFYQQHPRKRWGFIAIHIQPILLVWSLEISMLFGFVIWLYTVTGALLLNVIRNWDNQGLFALSLTCIGIVIVLTQAHEFSFFALVIYIFYLIKLLFSFSVVHHREVSK